MSIEIVKRYLDEKTREEVDGLVIGAGASREAIEFGDWVIKTPIGLFSHNEGDGKPYHVDCEGCRWRDYDTDPEDCYDCEWKEGSYSRTGVDQSQNELEIYVDCPDHLRDILCPVVDFYWEGDAPVIIMERITVANDLLIQGDGKLRRVCEKYNVDYDVFMEKVLELCKIFKLEKHDLINNTGNFGITMDGRIVLCDFGLTEEFDWD